MGATLRSKNNVSGKIFLEFVILSERHGRINVFARQILSLYIGKDSPLN